LDLMFIQQYLSENKEAILCNNVLLHFQPDERVEVIEMYPKALLPGGYFATEQTQKLPHELPRYFEQVAPDSQLFRKIGTIT